MRVAGSLDSDVMVSVLPEAFAVAHVVPPSVLYCHDRIGAPPSDASATVAISVWSARVTSEIVGCPGTVAGIAVTGVEAAPLPWSLTARTLTS